MPDAIPVSATPNTNSVQTPAAVEPAAKADPKAPAAIAAVPSKATAEQAATNQGEAAVRKFKLKIDGQELELPENEVIARAQRSSAADKRWQEAQQTRAQAEEFVNLLKTNFTQLLDDPRLGFDEGQKRKMLEDYYKTKYIDPEVLTPEQKAQRDRDLKLSKYEQDEKRREQQTQQQREQHLEQFHVENYQKTIVAALSTEGIPKTEHTVKRMADVLSKNLAMGIDLTPDQLAASVREDYQGELRAVVGAAEGEALLKLLGDDIANRLRKADLARLRAGMPQVPQPIVETAKASAPTSPRKYQTWDEMQAERNRRAGELQQSWKK